MLSICLYWYLSINLIIVLGFFLGNNYFIIIIQQECEISEQIVTVYSNPDFRSDIYIYWKIGSKILQK